MKNDFDAFMDDFFDFYSHNKVGKWPLVNVTEGERNYQIDVSLPGYAQGDVDVKIDKHILTLATSKAFEDKNKETEETNRTYLIQETHEIGPFSRSFRLPSEVDEDKISAHFVNGILTIIIEKIPLAQPKEIAIEVKTE